jgi:hypothetical protein
VARCGTPQDVVWLASGTGIFDTGIKKIWAKKSPAEAGLNFHTV